MQLIGLWVLPRTWTLLREAGQVLMQGVPKGVDLDAVRHALRSNPGSPRPTTFTSGRWLHANR
ncbi:hypothetical protein GIW57_22990 [Stenotrophomonas sp. PA-6-5C]|nr:hypothetical protein [Stenotrophomonas sp. PA-6-5C]